MAKGKNGGGRAANETTMVDLCCEFDIADALERGLRAFDVEYLMEDWDDLSPEQRSAVQSTGVLSNRLDALDVNLISDTTGSTTSPSQPRSQSYSPIESGSSLEPDGLPVPNLYAPVDDDPFGSSDGFDAPPSPGGLSSRSSTPSISSSVEGDEASPSHRLPRPSRTTEAIGLQKQRRILLQHHHPAARAGGRRVSGQPLAPAPPTSTQLPDQSPGAGPSTAPVAPTPPTKTFRQSRGYRRSKAHFNRAEIQERLREAWRKRCEEKAGRNPQYEVDIDIGDLPKRGEYFGQPLRKPKPAPKLKGSEKVKARRTLAKGKMKAAACDEYDDLVEAGKGPATLGASIFDILGRKIAYRAYVRGKNAKAGGFLNAIISKAVRRFEAAVKDPEHEPGHVRGDYPQRTFMIHRSFVPKPQYNVYLTDHFPHVRTLADDLKEVIEELSRIFQAQFPDHYAHYVQTLQEIEKDNSTLKPFWGPFASMAINSGPRVQTKLHKDPDNLATGFCAVIPYGHFDYRRSARLVINFNGKRVAFEIPPGVPFFLPSALLEHYNTSVDIKDSRGSLVFWTSGRLFQYVDHGCKAVKDLSPAYLRRWLSGLQERVQEAMDRYPKRKQEGL